MLFRSPHEIQAQVKGFRRISNLQQKPFENIVKDWFKRHKDIHKLNDTEQEEIIGKLINYNKSI